MRTLPNRCVRLRNPPYDFDMLEVNCNAAGQPSEKYDIIIAVFT